MTDLPTHPFELRKLDQQAATAFDITPPADALAAIAAELGLLELRKLRFRGELAPQGARDWSLRGDLGATVVQPCVATLAPVVTRLDLPVKRIFLRDMPETEEEDAEGTRIVEDETLELLTPVIDPAAIMIEALSLALPLYPRATDAEQVTAQAAPDGVTPMSDEETRPFAGLAALRDKLADKT